MKYVVIYALVFALVACAQTPAENSATQTWSNTGTFKSISDVPVNETTLFVFDIDDTLLTASTFFGSDYWYQWQKHLDKTDLNYVKCRWDILAIAYELGDQVVPNDTTANPVEVFNSIEVDKLILTSRSPDYRPGTIRELKRNGYQLPAPLSPGFDGQYITLNDKIENKSQPASYNQGVMMTTGFNKGLALYDLLSRAGKDYQTIVMIDDGEGNIKNVAAEAKKHNDNFIGFVYTAGNKTEPPTINPEKIKSANKSYQAILDTLRAVYPARYQKLTSGCGYD